MDGEKRKLAAGWWRPRISGEPDDLAGTHSRRAEPSDEDTHSSVLLEAASSGIQGGEGMASDARRRGARSLAAEGATAHECAAVHNTPPQMIQVQPDTLASIVLATCGCQDDSCRFLNDLHQWTGSNSAASGDQPHS